MLEAFGLGLNICGEAGRGGEMIVSKTVPRFAQRSFRKTLIPVLTALLTQLVHSAPLGFVPEIAVRNSGKGGYPLLHPTFPGGVVGVPDVIYARLSGFRPLVLDLYLPPASLHVPERGFPTVVFIHGGGWITGDKRHAGWFNDFPRVLAALAARGYVVASVSYRLSSEAGFPAAEIDVKTAISWLRSKAGLYHIDPARVAVWGGSAGGQLAGLTAVTCGDRAFTPGSSAGNDAASGAASARGEGNRATSYCVQAAVTWYGIFDFATLAQPGPHQTGSTAVGWMPRSYLGCELLRCPPETLAFASSTTYIDAGDPPMLLIHGETDGVVSYRQSVEMATRLKTAGVHAELLLIKGVGHGFTGRNRKQTRKASLQALQATFDFFDRTIGSPLSQR